MKNVVYSALFFSAIVYGQVEKKVGDFNKVTAFDQIDVLLVKSNENKVILDGKEANEVELVNKNGELKIRMPLTKLLGGDHISVTVYYKSITAVEANEGSRVACDDVLQSVAFDVNAKEGSEIKIKVDTEKLTVRVANGSKVTVEGNSDYQDVLVNSGGIYEADKLKTKLTTVTANAGGMADVFASDSVDAKVRAGGDITIYGKPKQINQKVVAGGTIHEAK
ncbi:head GIN domain-containing protein [Flavobacterium sedimenticola]|uniref:Head GIN domain-containing protein n=1 Tax=Flavobacterium sedimenticola TaxID=3043286 RepID=A0ABT6XLX2_9FLAO|nr:head GIN domain-containing protein [Flavobacterium sedimenticola]MDI9256089.1 head GIN domain-containing protein [Flavobacterium sedimenticola]